MQQGLVLHFSHHNLRKFVNQGLQDTKASSLQMRTSHASLSTKFGFALTIGNGTSSKAETAQDPLEAEVEVEAQSSSQQKQDQSSSTSKQKDKAKENAKASDKDKRSSKEKDRGKRKRKSKDFEDLKSKLPPNLKTFDFNDFQDMDALKAKLDEFKIKEEGEVSHCRTCEYQWPILHMLVMLPL